MMNENPNRIVIKAFRDILSGNNAHCRKRMSTIKESIALKRCHTETLSDMSTFSVDIPICAPIPAPVPVHAPIPAPVPVHAPIPAPVPVHAPIPAPVPVHAPIPAPVPIRAPIPAPVPIRAAIPVPVPIRAPVPVPVPAVDCWVTPPELLAEQIVRKHSDYFSIGNGNLLSTKSYYARSYLEDLRELNSRPFIASDAKGIIPPMPNFKEEVRNTSCHDYIFKGEEATEMKQSDEENFEKKFGLTPKTITQYSPNKENIKIYDNSRNLRSKASFNEYSYLPRYDSREFQNFSFDIGFIDTHCHLDFLFKRAHHNGSLEEYRELLKETFPASYEGCVSVFCHPLTFDQNVWKNIIEEDGIWTTFGCHPHYASNYNSDIHSALVRALEHDKVRALGEIGLDYSNRNDCPKAVQHRVFKRQLQLAVEMRLPLVIHNRNAFEDCLDIMKKYVPWDHKIHLHCCMDSWEMAKTWLDSFPNLFIGLTNAITFTSTRNVHNIARNIPLDRLLLETDAPYFLPAMLPRNLQWSHPGMAIHVAAQVAALKNISLRETLKAVRQNTRKMYKI